MGIQKLITLLCLNLPRKEESKPGQILVDHSTGILVKDRKGKLRLLVKNDVMVEDLEHDVKLLLAEKI